MKAKTIVFERWQAWTSAGREVALKAYEALLQAVIDTVCPDPAAAISLSLARTEELSPELCLVSIDRRKLRVEIPPEFFEPNVYTLSLAFRLLAVMLILPFVAVQMTDKPISFSLSLGDDSTGADVGFCATDDCLLIPDPEFLLTRSYDDFRKHAKAAWVPWVERRRGIFWRGSSTGRSRAGELPSSGPEWYTILPRLELCARLRKLPYCAFCDVGISSVVQIDDPILVQKIETQLQSKSIPQIAQMKWRYLISIDGNTSPWQGLMQSLILGACVIKVESRYRQWYYNRLQPEHNIVAVKSDLSDLERQVTLSLLSPKRSERIARNGHALAQGIDFEHCVSEAVANLLDRFA